MVNWTRIMKKSVTDIKYIKNDQNHSFSIFSIGFYTVMITIIKSENDHTILRFKVFFSM